MIVEHIRCSNYFSALSKAAVCASVILYIIRYVLYVSWLLLCCHKLLNKSVTTKNYLQVVAQTAIFTTVYTCFIHVTLRIYILFFVPNLLALVCNFIYYYFVCEYHVSHQWFHRPYGATIALEYNLWFWTANSHLHILVNT